MRRRWPYEDPQQHLQHQIEIVRLNALWDQAHVDNEAIMSVVEFIDDDKVIEALAQNARAQYVSLPEKVDGQKADDANLEFVKELNRKRGEEHASLHERR